MSRVVDFRFRYTDLSDAFYRQSVEIYDPIAAASSAAIRAAAAQVKARGRANIAAAGFSRRWQNALRTEVYPRGTKVSANAAALIWHKIPYADVFEAGATITGSPLLWLPLRTTPKKAGGKRLTPRQFVAEIGPLQTIPNGRVPLLGAPMAVPRFQALRGGPFKPTVAALRKGTKRSRSFRNDNQARIYVRTVPLFHGVRAVTLQKRFAISAIIRQAADDLPALYRAALKAE